jgi:hypothetical protein
MERALGGVGGWGEGWGGGGRGGNIGFKDQTGARLK